MKKILLLLLVNILSAFILFGCKSVDDLVKEGKYEEAYTVAKSNNEKNKVEWSLYSNKMYETLFSIVEPSRRHIYINRLIDDNEYKNAYLYADNDEEKKEIISKIIDKKAYYKLTISDDEKQMYLDVANELERREEIGESVIVYCSLGTSEKKDLIDNYIDLMIGEENINWLEKTNSYVKDKEIKDKISIKCYDYYWDKNDYKKCYGIANYIVSDPNYERWVIAKMIENGEFKKLTVSNSDESKKYNFYVNNVYYTIRWTTQQLDAESLSKIKDIKKQYINSLKKVFNFLYTSKYDDDFKKTEIGRWYKKNSDSKSNTLLFHRDYGSFLDKFMIATIGEHSSVRDINSSGNYGYEKYTRGKSYWENDKLICFYLDTTTGYDNQNLYKKVYAEALSNKLDKNEGIAGLLPLFNSYIYSEDISWTITTREGKSIDVFKAVKDALINEVDNGKI